MARPQRNTVDYFPFYCAEGKKMFYLEETYGNDGFAVFLKILRELAKSEYHYLDLSKKTTLMFLSAKCKVSVETLEAIINDLVDLEKFDSVLWNENHIIWCQDFIDSIQDAYKKRNNNCVTRNTLILLLEAKGIRNPAKSNPKQPKSDTKGDGNTQTILKKRKEDKSITERELNFKDELRSYKTQYTDEILKAFFSYWSEPDKQKTKMRFEMQRTWDTKKRLVTWNNNTYGRK